MTETPENGQRPTVPIEHAGKWLAWSNDGTRIIAAESTYEEAKAAAERAGEAKPVLGKAPSADVRFIG